MELYKAVWSGIVDGLVDLSPLSDGAHFEIYKMIIPDSAERVTAILAMSSLGSLAALLFYFRREYAALFRKSGHGKLVKLLLMSLPLCVAYILLATLIESIPTIMNPIFAVVLMIVSGVIVLNFKKIFHPKANSGHAINKKSALGLGFISILSLLPGFSRIMLTTLVGRIMNIKEGKSLRYSILASAPFLLVVFIRSFFVLDGAEFFVSEFGPVLLANLVSFIVSLFVLRLIMKNEEEKVMRFAAWYQVMLGLFILFFELVKF